MLSYAIVRETTMKIVYLRKGLIPHRLVILYHALPFLLMMTLLISWPCDTGAGNGDNKAMLSELDEIEKKVKAHVPAKEYPDDPFILVTLQEAITAIREGNGGIGACLVKSTTGEIVERGHNRQFEPYFRSDLHAEMDLLNRYEDSVKGRRQGRGTMPTAEQRKIEDLALYTSLEPCPMCLTRIINIGVKKVYFAVSDPTGGMAYKLGDLPPFWRDRASGQVFEPARCSSELRQLARRLFRHSMANK
jgi:tRNA(adenine34) deaminase